MKKRYFAGVIALVSLTMGCVPGDPYLGPPDLGSGGPTYSEDGRIRYEQSPSDPLCTQSVDVQTGEIVDYICA